MQTITRRLALSLPLVLAGTTLARPAGAQSGYPAKPITMLVGFPPGGSGDFVARLVGQKLAEALGKPVVIENRAGANGLIAAQATASAPPDGYTLFLASMGLTTNPHLYAKSRLDPVKDFTSISLLATVPNVLVVHPSVPAKNIEELLRYARSSKDSLTVATTGKAAPGHLTSELLQRAAKIRFEFVAYKGSGPALSDVMAGHVNMSFPTVLAALPGIKSGKLRAIAITGDKRSTLLPDVPTLAEAGLKGMATGSGWYGLVGPAGLPSEIVGRISSEVSKIMKSPDVRERFLANGADPVGSGISETAAFIAQDYKRWGELIKAANIKAEEE